MAIIRTYEPERWSYTPTDQIQRNLSAEVQKQIKTFLKKGGKIVKVSTGISGEAFEFMEKFTDADMKKFKKELIAMGLPNESRADFFFDKREGRFVAFLCGNRIGTFTHPKLAMDAIRNKAKLISGKRK